MTHSIEQRLHRIEARHAIGDLVARYAAAADRRNDPAMMAPLFADDATWSSEGFAALQGRDAITRGLAAIAAERVLWSIHYMTPPLVVLAEDGMSADCQWYLWELCTMRTDDGPRDQWLGGWYDGSARMGNDGWKFSRIILDVRLQGEASPPWSLRKPVQA
ncbi:MAG: nuclear transport factor 2 family protein [Sphingobium sp.]